LKVDADECSLCSLCHPLQLDRAFTWQSASYQTILIQA
jgi:hypothetical protein